MRQRIRAALESDASPEEIGKIIDAALAEAAKQHLEGQMRQSKDFMTWEAPEDDPFSPEKVAQIMEHTERAYGRAAEVLPKGDNATLIAEIGDINATLKKNETTTLADLDREAASARAELSPEEQAAFDATMEDEKSFTMPPLVAEHASAITLTPEEEADLFRKPDFNPAPETSSETPVFTKDDLANIFNPPEPTDDPDIGGITEVDAQPEDLSTDTDAELPPARRRSIPSHEQGARNNAQIA
jgi:hypothetical protein